MCPNKHLHQDCVLHIESSVFIEDMLVGQLTDAQCRDQSVEIIKPDTFKRA